MAEGSDGRAAPHRGFPWFGGGRKQSIPDGSVFISYRRGDSAGHTGRLYDRLSADFGDAAIFMDIDTIDPGVDFAERIREALATCRVVLVVIGPQWITAADDGGGRRLDDPHDYLRMEIAASLRRESVLVVPVLVAGAQMPTRDQLPGPLQPLARRNAVELSDSRWNFDVNRLEGVVRRAVERRAEPPPPEAPPTARPATVGGGRRPRSPDPPIAEGGGWDERPKRRLSSALLGTILVAAIGGGWLLVDELLSSPAGGTETAGASESASPDQAEPTTAASEPSGGDGNATGPPSEPQSEPPPQPDIAFVRNGELWGMTDDGKERRRVLDLPLPVNHPDWASDGRVVFSSTRDEGDFKADDTEIWVVDANGENLQQLTDNRINDATPDWSPDGTRIAYSSSVDDLIRDIVVMSADGSRPVNLTNTADEDDDTPDWSPDGSQIVWEREVNGQHDIWRMDDLGDNAEAVTETPGVNDFWPAWSPDGDTIAFRSNYGRGVGLYDIVTVDATATATSTSEYDQLTSDAADNHQPAWSPDGKLIAFVKDVKRSRDLYIVPATGGGPSRLTRKGMDTHPVWRPKAQ